jgi:hypothetical protein
MFAPLLCISLFLNPLSLSQDDVRQSFLRATQDAGLRQNLVKVLESPARQGDVFSLAYLGAANTLMAESASLPWTKYNLFTAGKEQLESAIKQAPRQAEYRYLRFMIQLNSPALLDYKHDLKSDYRLVQAAIDSASKRALWMDHFEAFKRTHQAVIQEQVLNT